IHMGETTILADRPQSFAYVDGRHEGIQWNRCAGTYLHGAFENSTVVAEWIGFRPPEPPGKEQVYDRLGDWFEQAADATLFKQLFL
ncbi:MAG: cobyric acid synthase, partial [Terriglobia bacterium]